ncbi:MAG: hypothetical protein IPM18_04555 [Phycisphaerales bacterium]|nr:hypothetical protein [Phycisphaerales bacterium]
MDSDIFNRWVDFIFSRALHRTDADFEDEDVNRTLPEEEDDELILSFLQRLFQSPQHLLERYSDLQIDAGLREITGVRQYTFELVRKDLPLEPRCRCVAAMTQLFAGLFAPIYGDSLGHRNQPTRAGFINGACYGWWGAVWVDEESMEEAFAAHVRDVLQLPSEACCEGALHGMGHWRGTQGRKWIEDLIDEWLDARPHASPALRQYAGWARSGCVQ